MLTKILLISLLSVFSFAADSCISKSFGGTAFYDKTETTNVWNNQKNKFVLEESKFANLFPNCTTNKLNFFQYSYRKDLKDIVLIQFIFKGNSISFKNAINNIVKDSKFTKAYKSEFSKPIGNKQVIIEFINATTGENITYNKGVLDYQKPTTKK